MFTILVISTDGSFYTFFMLKTVFFRSCNMSAQRPKQPGEGGNLLSVLSPCENRHVDVMSMHCPPPLKHGTRTLGL